MTTKAVAPQLVEVLRRDAAERTGTAMADWVIVAQRDTMWTDTSLGVREPGRMYGKIMVPGARVVLRNGHDGMRELVYHTGFAGAYKFSREQRRSPDLGLD